MREAKANDIGYLNGDEPQEEPKKVAKKKTTTKKGTTKKTAAKSKETKTTTKTSAKKKETSEPKKTATKKLTIGCKIKSRHPALLNYYHFGNELTTKPPNESMTAKMSSKAIPSTHPTMSGAPAIATNAKTSFFAIVASAATI